MLILKKILYILNFDSGFPILKGVVCTFILKYFENAQVIIEWVSIYSYLWPGLLTFRKRAIFYADF